VLVGSGVLVGVAVLVGNGVFVGTGVQVAGTGVLVSLGCGNGTAVGVALGTAVPTAIGVAVCTGIGVAGGSPGIGVKVSPITAVASDGLSLAGMTVQVDVGGSGSSGLIPTVGAPGNTRAGGLPPVTSRG
jgi:hypothetical protein